MPRISQVFLMLAVTGLWIEHHARWKASGYSFLQLYRQALTGFATLAVKKLAAPDSLQLQPSPASRPYDRRELRMRW